MDALLASRNNEGAMPDQSQEGCIAFCDNDEDEKQKIFRWQIGSGSIGVLEQVYALEPFPGTRPRNDLRNTRSLTPRPSLISHPRLVTSPPSI